MRFITEFEIRKEETKPEIVIQYRKERGENGLGYLLAKSFGWENPVNENKLHHRLEIEAFPMDKWVEFKQKLFMECGMPKPNGVAILEMIKDLEFYTNNKQAVDSLIGKPSGDAITNQQTNTNNG